MKRRIQWRIHFITYFIQLHVSNEWTFQWIQKVELNTFSVPFRQKWVTFHFYSCFHPKVSLVSSKTRGAGVRGKVTADLSAGLQHLHTQHQVDTLTWTSKIPRGGFLFCLKIGLYYCILQEATCHHNMNSFGNYVLTLLVSECLHLLHLTKRSWKCLAPIENYWILSILLPHTRDPLKSSKRQHQVVVFLEIIIDGCPELDGCPSNVPVCRCRKEVRDRLLLGQKKSFKLWNIFNINIIYILHIIYVTITIRVLY